MNIVKTSDGKNEYGKFFALGLLRMFAGNVNAITQEQPQTTTASIESPLKFTREIRVDQYMIERLNYTRILDMLTHQEGKRRNPKFGATKFVGDTWIKQLKGVGYVSMMTDESGIYLFLFDKPPKSMDFYSLQSQAKMVGRQSSRLDRIFGIKKL